MNLLKPAEESRMLLPEEISALSPEAQQGRFHGKEIPYISSSVEVEKETPTHVLAAKCLALGMTAKETAAYTELSEQMIKILWRQPWFQERMREFMKSQGTDLLDMFKAEALGSLQKMIELRDDPKTPKSVVFQCCKEFFDRHLGKPTQTVISDVHHTTGDPVEEVERLERENAKLRETSLS